MSFKTLALIKKNFIKNIKIKFSRISSLKVEFYVINVVETIKESSMKKFIFTLLFTFICVQTVLADKITDDELFYAIIKGETYNVQRLLSEGADPNISNPDSGFTGLMRASLFSDNSILVLLLNAGADVNKETKNGKTALYYAVSNNDVDKVSILLNYGANADTKTIEGESLHSVARRNNNRNIMSMLFSASNRVTLNNYTEVNTTSALYILDDEASSIIKKDIAEDRPKTKANKFLYYSLNKNIYQATIDEYILRKTNPPKMFLITPYSLAKYYYKLSENKNNIEPYATLSIIKNYKNIAWIYVEPDKKISVINEVVIKIGEGRYPALAKDRYIPYELFRKTNLKVDNLWPFPANLFSKENDFLDIIVSYPAGKENNITIKNDFYNNKNIK